MQPKCWANTLFIRHTVIAACYRRAAPVYPPPPPPLLKASPFSQPSESLTGAQNHHNKETDGMKIWLLHREDESGGWKQTSSYLATLARDLERKWQWWSTMGDNVTYPSPDTESACGWACSELFPSPPCRTARPLWGPSRMMPGRKSAERLSSWRRHPTDARKKGPERDLLTETFTKMPLLQLPLKQLI